MRKIFSFMLGAIAGGVLGAAAAMLLTPVSGNEMRIQVNSRLRKMQQEIQDARIQKRTELEDQLRALRAPKA